jgi:hypothetical protein
MSSKWVHRLLVRQLEVGAIDGPTLKWMILHDIVCLGLMQIVKYLLGCHKLTSSRSSQELGHVIAYLETTNRTGMQQLTNGITVTEASSVHQLFTLFRISTPSGLFQLTKCTWVNGFNEP